MTVLLKPRMIPGGLTVILSMVNSTIFMRNFPYG